MTKFSQIASAPGIPAATDTVLGVGSGTTDYQYTIAQLMAALGLHPLPQGRLTLQSGAPVQNADQTAKTTVYYDSYAGNSVAIWNGVQWVSLVITSDEISMGLDAGVPHVAAGSLYDIFAINNSGSLVIAAGPAWSSLSSRGSGAGTTELQRFNGVLTNKNSLTHAWGGASGTTDYGAVSVNQATYLGTIYATANGQTSMALQPAGAAGGSNAIIGVFNAYNRVRAVCRSLDTTAGSPAYTYALTTWRPANNNNNNRITFVDGLQVIGIDVFWSIHTENNGGVPVIGINLDSTSAAPNFCIQSNIGSASVGPQPFVEGNFYPQLGLHFVQAMEVCGNTSTTNFFCVQTTPTRQLQQLWMDWEI